MVEKTTIIGTILSHVDDEGRLITFAPSADFDRFHIDAKIKWTKKIKDLSKIMKAKFEKDRDNAND